jgi:hypothetical protein
MKGDDRTFRRRGDGEVGEWYGVVQAQVPLLADPQNRDTVDAELHKPRVLGAGKVKIGVAVGGGVVPAKWLQNRGEEGC